MEVATVFLETNLGTSLAVSFPASATTIADLKRRVSDEHAASFPSIGQITVQAIKVRRRSGTLYHLTDSMAVRDAFPLAADPWTLQVDALPRSPLPLGCRKRSLCEMLTAHAQLEATHTGTQRVTAPTAEKILCVLNEQCSIDDVHISAGAATKEVTHPAPCVEQLKQGDPSEKQVEEKETWTTKVCDAERSSKGTELVPPPCAAEPTKEVTHPAPCVEQLKQGDPSEKQVEEKETWTAKVCDGERSSKGTELVPPPCAAEPTKEVTHPAPCAEQLKQGDPSEKQVEEKETWTAKVCDGERSSKGTELVPPPCAAEPTKEVTHPAPCAEQLKQGDPSEKQVEEKETWTAKVCDGERSSKGTQLVPPPCAAEPTKEANSSAQSSPGAVPPMYYSLLKDLTDRSPSCRIRTRIARLWKHELQRKNRKHHMQSDKYLVGLHMVLVDEEGQGIHAFVPKSLINEGLKEGRVYYFQNFKIMQVKAGTPWRCVYHSCEVRFTARTQFNPILPEPDDFPPYAHCLRSFKDILDTVEDNTYLADVVGLVTGISDIVRFKFKPKRTVRLYDGSDHAIINLWDEFAYERDADELIRTSESEPVILLAMGCTFKKEYSMLSLNTAYGFRMRINPASDVSGFRNRIIGIDHKIKRIDHKGNFVVENTSVTNLVSEGSSSGAGHTGSCVDAVSAGDPVAERTVSVAQEHNAELSSSLDPKSLEKNEPASGEMSRTHVVGKKRATPPGDVLATPSDIERSTRSSSNGGDNPRGPSGKKKKKSDKDPNMLAKAARSSLFPRVKKFCFAGWSWSGRGGARS